MKDEESRRQQILQVVAACVASEGMKGATMRNIAERLNVSTGMITYYYKNKRELIAETVAQAGKHFAERALEVAGSPTGLRWLEADFDVALAHRDQDSPPWSFWFEWWAEAIRDPELRRHHVETAIKRQRTRAGAVQGAIDAGEIAADLDPMLVADLLGAVFQGLGVKMTVDAEIFPPERASQVVQLMLSLLARTPSQAETLDSDGHETATKRRRAAPAGP